MKRQLKGNNKYPSRSGFTLLVVLVVVSALSLIVYAYVDRMTSAFRMTRGYLRSLEVRRAAESGIELAAAALEEATRGDPSRGGVDEAKMHGLRNGSETLSPYIVSIVKPGRKLPTLSSIDKTQLGLENLSGRLNLRSLPLSHQRRPEARQRLMALPSMTSQIADAILDWMDPDEEPSEFGAEASYYNTVSSSKAPLNAPVERLDELLAVRGVTRQLLFGEESGTPRSGNAEISATPSSTPWCMYLTVDGAESNYMRNGEKKINVNGADMVGVYDRILAELGEKAASYIVAMRLVGTTEAEGRALSQSSGGDGKSASSRQKAAILRAQQQQSEAGVGNKGKRTAEIRAGMDLSRKPAFVIRSVFDLIGTKVRIDIDHKEVLLRSPWGGDAPDLSRTLQQMESVLAFGDEEVMNHRINVLEAPRPVLLSVPGMTTELADQLIALRSKTSNPLTEIYADKQGDMREIRNVLQYLTMGGDVYRGVSVVHVDGTRNALALEFVIDNTHTPAILLEMRER